MLQTCINPLLLKEDPPEEVWLVPVELSVALISKLLLLKDVWSTRGRFSSSSSAKEFLCPLFWDDRKLELLFFMSFPITEAAKLKFLIKMICHKHGFFRSPPMPYH